MKKYMIYAIFVLFLSSSTLALIMANGYPITITSLEIKDINGNPRTVFSRSAQDVVVIETKIKRECVYYAGSPINYLEIIAIFRSDVMMNLLLTRDSISPCEEKSFGGGYSVRPCDPLGVYDVEVYVWNGFPSEMGSSFAILAESKHAQFTVNP